MIRSGHVPDRQAPGIVSFDLVRDFGVLTSGDSSLRAHHANSAAFMAANAASRAALARGAARVHWTMPPNVRGFYHRVLAGSMFHGLTRFTVDWNGAHFTDAASGLTSSAYGGACNPLLYQLPEARMATASTGQQYVECLAAHDAAYFPVGGWVLIGCLAIQTGGYPPNYQIFEYRRVVAVSGRRIMLDRPLANEYRADYPDYGAPGATNVNWRGERDLKGAARIHLLDHRTADGKPIPWGVDQHHLSGVFDLAAATKDCTSYLMGLSVKYTNMQIGGWTPTVAGRIEMERCPPETYNNEPDKLVERIVVRDSHIRRWVFQSASIGVCDIHNSEIDALGIGALQRFVMVGGHVKALGFQVDYGVGGGSTFIQTHIDAVPYGLDPFGHAFRLFTVDGVKVRYAGGAFRAPLDDAAVIPSALMLRRGTRIMLCQGAKGDLYPSSDYAVGVVTRCRQDGRDVVLETSLPFATLPPWASGAVYVGCYNRATLMECSGAPEIERASDAHRHGKEAGDYGVFRLSGRLEREKLLTRTAGRLSRVAVNVLTPAGARAGSSPRLQISQYTGNAATGAAQPPLAVSIDLAVAGARFVDYRGWTGRRGGDAVTRGAALAALPSDSFGDGATSWFSYDPKSAAIPSGDLPVIELTIEMEPAAIERRSGPVVLP